MPKTVWSPELYNQKHDFVYEYGEALVEVLAPQPHETILDLGCGTGELTHQISLSGAEVAGIDSAKELVEKARQQYPQLTFRQQDATQLSDIEQYDAIFSNAVLHWVVDQEQLTVAMFRALKPGGRLVVEFGGKGNVQQIVSALQEALRQHGYPQPANQSLWYFPTIGQHTGLLERHGFWVQWAQHYERPTRLTDTENGIKDWLRMFANSYLNDVDSRAQEVILEDVQRAVHPSLHHDGQWYADYQRLRSSL